MRLLQHFRRISQKWLWISIIGYGFCAMAAFLSLSFIGRLLAILPLAMGIVLLGIAFVMSMQSLMRLSEPETNPAALLIMGYWALLLALPAIGLAILG